MIGEILIFGAKVFVATVMVIFALALTAALDWW